MTLVKIIPESIKLNPRAGQTVSWVQGPRSAKFWFPEGGKIPVDLLPKVEVTEWRDSKEPANGVHLAGYILNPDDFPLFISIPGIQISVDKGLQKIHHKPESPWLFEYEDPAIKCGNFGEMVPVSEIGQDSLFDGESDVLVDQVCPHCDAYDTFGEIEYEKIEDALKAARK